MNEVLYEIDRMKVNVTAVTENKKMGKGSENLGKYNYLYLQLVKEIHYSNFVLQYWS